MTAGLRPSVGRNCGSWMHQLAATTRPLGIARTKVLNIVLICATVVRVRARTRTTKKAIRPSGELARWFLDSLQKLWPAAEGSLSLRKSSCVRPNCPACLAGEGHRSYVLYGNSAKKRFSIYVPDELVPEIQLALENGRRLRDLIAEAGVRYTRALKDERKSRLLRERKGESDAG
jgi:hypothetical protein